MNSLETNNIFPLCIPSALLSVLYIVWCSRDVCWRWPFHVSAPSVTIFSVKTRTAWTPYSSPSAYCRQKCMSRADPIFGQEVSLGELKVTSRTEGTHSSATPQSVQASQGKLTGLWILHRFHWKENLDEEWKHIHHLWTQKASHEKDKLNLL